MINFAYENLFREDSVDKQISIVSDDSTVTLTNDDIVGDSLEIIESISSEENLMFGSIESNCLKFTVAYSAPRMNGKWLTVKLFLGADQREFTLGRYKVRSDKPSSDRSTRQIIAYDGLYKILTNTYKKWYNSLWESNSQMTVKQFRDAWFTRLQTTYTWLTQETVTLPNDSVKIKKSRKISKPTGREIFRVICEMNGCFGHIGRDNVFHYIRPKDSNTSYTIDKTYTISAEYEDYTTMAIDRVEVLSKDGEVLGAAGQTADDANNTYIVENNFLIKWMIDSEDSFSKTQADLIANNLLAAIGGTTFTPFTAEFKGDPCYEVGDRIGFWGKSALQTSFILSRTMRGIQSLHDEFSAQGEEVYPEKLNNKTSKIKDLENSVGVIDTQLDDMPVLEIQNDGTISISASPNRENLYSRSFQVVSHNVNLPAPHYQVWEVTATSTENIVLCISPCIIGGTRRTFTVDGELYQDSYVAIVGGAYIDIYQKWVSGLPLSIGNYAPYPYNDRYGWSSQYNSKYWKAENGVGTTTHDIYSGYDSSTDHTYTAHSGNTEGTFTYALNNELIDLPSTTEDVKTLPTQTDALNLSNSADCLAKALQGQSYERKQPSFTGQVDVISSSTLQNLADVLDAIRVNIPTANPSETATDELETIKLNGTVYEIKDTEVEITPTLATGTKIANYSIDGVRGALYAPEGGGGGDTETLWSGTVTAVADEGTLSSAYSDFSYLLICGSDNFTQLVDCSLLANSTTVMCNAFGVVYAKLTFDTTTHFSITEVGTIDGFSFSITQIVGMTNIGGSGGGSSFQRETIYSATAQADTYTLSSPLTDFDAITVFAKGGTSTMYRASSFFTTDELMAEEGDTSARFAVTTDGWYSYFSVTDESTLTRQDTGSLWVYAIVGLKFGCGSSGGGGGYSETSLYTATTRSMTMQLSDDIDNFDAIGIRAEWTYNGASLGFYTQIPSSQMELNRYFCTGGEGRYQYIAKTGSDTLSLPSISGTWDGSSIITEIIGIKFS